jgi:hypothetical protein
VHVGTTLPIVVSEDGGMAQIGLSNWSRTDLFGLDFAPACKNPGDGNRPCRASYVQEKHGPIKPADDLFIIGDDDRRTYWTSVFKVKRQRARFQSRWRRISRLDNKCVYG